MSVLTCFHVCNTPVYVRALSGLTGCLRPRAVRPGPGTVLSRGRDSGAESRGWGIFDSIMSCCLLWSCEAARRGTVEHCAELSSAQELRPAGEGRATLRRKHPLDCSVCVGYRFVSYLSIFLQFQAVFILFFNSLWSL